MHGQRKAKPRRLFPIAAAASALTIGAATSQRAQAGSYTWNRTSSGTWSDPASWVGGLAPVSGNDTYVKFNSPSGPNYTATQDIADPLKLWILELGGAPTGSQPHALTGQPIEFVSNPAAVDPIPQSPVLAQSYFNPTSGGWAIHNNLIFTNDVSMGSPGAASAPVTFNGIISGAGKMTVTSGIWRVNNVGINWTGGVDAQNAQVIVGPNGNLGTGFARVSGAGGRLSYPNPGANTPNTIHAEGGFVQFGPFPSTTRLTTNSTGVLALAGSTSFPVNFSNHPNLRLGMWIDNINPPTTVTYSGSINLGNNTTYRFGGQDNLGNDSQTSDTLMITTQLTDTAGGIPRSVQIAGQGGGIRGGKVRLTHPFNSYSGGTVIENGTSDGNNLTALSIITSSPSPLGSGPVTVKGTLMIEEAGSVNNLTNQFNFKPGSVLMFNNITGTAGNYASAGDGTDRWGDGKPIDMNSSEIVFQTFSAAAQGPVERVGAVNFTGSSRMTIDHRGSGWNTTLRMASLNRVDRATMLFFGKQGPAYYSQSSIDVSTRFEILDIAAHREGSGMLKPYLLGDDFGVATPTPNYTQGLGHFLYGNTTNVSRMYMTSNMSAGSTAVVDYYTTVTTPMSNKTVHALRVHNDKWMDVWGPLTIDGGGLILGGMSNGGDQFFTTADGIAAPKGSIVFNSEAVIFANLNTANVNLPIVTSGGGLTKFGRANLALKAANNSLGGETHINEGYITIANAAALYPGGANDFTINDLGALNLNGHTVELKRLRGTGMVVNASNSASSATLILADQTGGGPGAVIPTQLRNGGSGKILALTKPNFANIILTGASTYSGLTRVEQGPLTLSGSNSGAGDYLTATTNASLHFTTPYTVGAIDGVGDTRVTGAAVTARHVRQRALDVDGTSAPAVMGIAAGGNSVSRVGTLNLQGNAKLDLADNKLIVAAGDIGALNGGNYTGIPGMIQSARAGGAWTGNGLTTSMPSAPQGLTTLAVAVAQEVGKETFGGVSVAPAEVLVMYTYAGDANLSGKVDADDYFQIDSNYSKPASVVAYHKGDFNYDGTINADDYFLIDSAFAGQGSVFSSAVPAAGVSSVPEPVGFASILLATAALRRRRR